MFCDTFCFAIYEGTCKVEYRVRFLLVRFLWAYKENEQTKSSLNTKPHSS